MLSPSSPISAAALTTKARPPSFSTRTLPVRCKPSATRAVTAGSSTGRSWFQTVTWIPAESRPRTSRRSTADKACWSDRRTPSPASLGRMRGERSDATPAWVPSRSRRTAHEASRRSTRAALAVSMPSTTSGSSSSSASRAAIRPGRSDKTAVIRSARPASRSRARRPGTPLSRRSASAVRAAASATHLADRSVRDPPSGPAIRSTASASRVRIESAVGTSRVDGRRRIAMMPHMW